MGYEQAKETARYFSASETEQNNIALCEPQIHLENDSKRISSSAAHKRLMQHLCYSFAIRSNKASQPKACPSAMYDCKVFNYSLPSKCINKLLNIIASLGLHLPRRCHFLRFHFVFNNIFVVRNKLKFSLWCCKHQKKLKEAALLNGSSIGE